MSEVQWIKLSTGLFDNRKIRQLRRLPEGNSIVLIWIFLLTLAGRCNAGGDIFITDNILYNEEMLAAEGGFRLSTLRSALDYLEKFRMISKEPLTILNWDKYQNSEQLEKIREQNRLRKQKQRNKQRMAEIERDTSVTGTEGHAIEEDKDKDKEILSVCPASEDVESCSHKTEAACSASFPDEDDLGSSTARTYMGGKLGRGLVFMSEEQIEDLLVKLSIDEFDHYVAVVAGCEESGKHYGKSHYKAILEMAAQDRRLRSDKMKEG